MASREQKFWQHYREEKAARQTGKPARKRPKAASVRHKDWTSGNLEDPDVFYDLALPESERVLPRGEWERRHSTWIAPVIEPEATAGATTSPAEEPVAPQTDSTNQGMVVEAAAGLCRVDLNGRVIQCIVRGSLKALHTGLTNVVAVGDQVSVTANGHDRGIVEAVLPRRSALTRPDVFYPHLQQVIVANVDQVLIVMSWREPALWPELLDRYLIAAERNRLAPVICLNKVDLVLGGDPTGPRAALAPYRALGYRVLFTSAQTGEGLAELAATLRGQMTVLTGLSGVGKSSLLSAIEPGLNLKVGDVSSRHHEGRHTTTQVHLHPLRGGGCVVDTPGIREFGLSGLRVGDLAAFYPEISAEAARCRFADCSHTREAGCAVRLAVRQGRIASVRYDNYRKIHRSLPS